MDNLLSYCGLVDAIMNASEKDLPVKRIIFGKFMTRIIPKKLNITSDSV